MRRALGVIAAVTTSSLLAGTAWAVWTTTGSGTGSATARGFSAVTVSAGTAPAGQLYPGGTGDLVVTASNPNPFPVTVTVALGTVTGCTTPALSLTPNVSASFTLPANASNAPRTLTGVLTMGDSSSNCQNATLTVGLTTSLVSG